ncbi:uncharacterized protein K460DRAFT_289817 [Cucurbitaria berberidis CBS 394.84]|uniref:RING-type domain-containing protein n=1 Tax=Cucurbitaria berberidis CBS 394.84 TaxID=1168544 RepID=A0A9P4GF17_9PLEO|nr:uncharacterized protein K460DRAFT_289817 [Cucurbitaria berberidis CBS 394.84]KAF1844259.1 hypothetical protein K460DRAFT_289817 [Cucurbitaria berberidis CBS 394.84]
MDNFLETQLHPAEICVVCTEPFSLSHQPVALPCKHIFGHECIKKWLKSGQGNSSACPTCRYVVVEKRTPRVDFDTSSIWKALCDQPPERLNSLMMAIWPGLKILWQRHPSGNFSITEILDQAVIPALIKTARRTESPQDRSYDPVLDCYNLVAASWDSLGRPDTATGLAIAFVRLARLMSTASATLPKWLTSTARTNRLLWRANASLGIFELDVSWDFIIEATNLEEEQYFPLLHLYTVLVSQSIAHNSQPTPWPTRRHDIMNLVVERCCTKIGGTFWKGKPSNKFKDVLVAVYEELRRYQLEKGKMSLRGHDGEERVVKGIWALAGWTAKKVEVR